MPTFILKGDETAAESKVQKTSVELEKLKLQAEAKKATYAGNTHAVAKSF